MTFVLNNNNNTSYYCYIVIMDVLQVSSLSGHSK